MLGKRSRPTTIRKPTSPRSPLDYRIVSPRSPKNYDQQGGVGLGIVVALDNNTSNYFGGEILAKYALNGRFSNPIPMNNNYYNKSECEAHEGVDDMLDEEFTYVTCHVPNKPKTTKVYYNGVAHGHGHGHGHVTRNGINQNLGVFTISSPATTFDYTGSYSDFLNSCHLCKNTLHGKDIYMYRGEKAFCSEECRQSQICNEERKEQCKSEASRSTNVSSSSHSYTTRRAHILSPGIMAL